jgi:hypothetical protein
LIGQHTATVRLATSISATITINVVKK